MRGSAAEAAPARGGGPGKIAAAPRSGDYIVVRSSPRRSSGPCVAFSWLAMARAGLPVAFTRPPRRVFVVFARLLIPNERGILMRGLILAIHGLLLTRILS